MSLKKFFTLMAGSGGSGYFVSNTPTGDEIDLTEFYALTLSSGQTFNFKRGQTFNFTKTIDAPNVTFGAYGTGADPVFIGSTSLSAATWTNEGSGFYSTPLASAPKWIFKDGIAARQGESNWIPVTANSTSNTITASAATLGAFSSLIGAKFRIKEYDFRLGYENTVTNYSSGVITYSGPAIAGGLTGMPFKLYGQQQFCTVEGDWFYNGTHLFIKTVATPAGTDIRACTEDRALQINEDGFSISDIELTQYYQEVLKSSAGNTITISDCNIHDIRTNGLTIYGNTTDHSITGNTITRCGLQGIHIGAIEDSVITDNEISNICQQGNIGWPIDSYWIKTGGCGIAFFWDSAQARKTALGITFKNNTVTDVGYCGILVVGDNHLIEENIFLGSCQKWNDGAGIYTIHRASLGDSTKNCIIRKNVVARSIGNIDGIVGSAALSGVGIYIDNGCELQTVDQNTVYNNVQYGILLNWDTQKSTVTNNIVFGNGDHQIMFRTWTDPAQSPLFPYNIGNILTGNTSVSEDTKCCVAVRDLDGNTSYNPFSSGGSSDNNIYIRPYDTKIGFMYTGSVEYDLAGWQSKFSMDASSVKSTRTLAVLQPNETLGIITRTYPGYFDTSGNSLATFDLNPYEAKVVLATPDILRDHFIGTNGTNLSGRTPQVGAAPTIVGGTHTIQSNKLVATGPGGQVSWTGQTNIHFDVKSRFTTIQSSNINAYVRYVNDNNTIRIAFFGTDNTLKIWSIVGGVVTPFSTPFTFEIDRDYIFSIIINGSSCQVYVDGVLYLNTSGITMLSSGSVGIYNDFGSIRRTSFVMAQNL